MAFAPPGRTIRGDTNPGCRSFVALPWADGFCLFEATFSIKNKRIQRLDVQEGCDSVTMEMVYKYVRCCPTKWTCSLQTKRLKRVNSCRFLKNLQVFRVTCDNVTMKKIGNNIAVTCVTFG